MIRELAEEFCPGCHAVLLPGQETSPDAHWPGCPSLTLRSWERPAGLGWPPLVMSVPGQPGPGRGDHPRPPRPPRDTP
jgi:hypothetical protein